MIDLFITYDHQMRPATARDKWWAVVAFLRSDRASEWQTVHVMPLATPDHLDDVRRWMKRASRRPELELRLASADVQPSDCDCLTRSLWLGSRTGLTRPINVRGLCNHLRAWAHEALIEQLKHRKQELDYERKLARQTNADVG